MKRFLFLALLLTGCGDVGSSSNANTVESNQVFNPEPVNCRTECTINIESGLISAIRECSGSEPFGIPIQSLDSCDEVTETVPFLTEEDSEESAE